MMRLFLILLAFLSVVSFQVTFGQEKGYTVHDKITNNEDTVLLHQKYKTNLDVGTSFMTNLKGGYGFENYISPRLSYFPSGSLKIDFSSVIGSVNFHKMSLIDYYSSSRIDGTSHYFGVSGQATYYLNDKLSFSSLGFAEKLPELDPLSLKNKTNYGGSFMVGYKFTDKFSMQAGIEIQKYDDPWNLNPMYNRGFRP
jgi:hypothetical protein